MQFTVSLISTQYVLSRELERNSSHFILNNDRFICLLSCRQESSGSLIWNMTAAFYFHDFPFPYLFSFFSFAFFLRGVEGVESTEALN